MSIKMPAMRRLEKVTVFPEQNPNSFPTRRRGLGRNADGFRTGGFRKFGGYKLLKLGVTKEYTKSATPYHCVFVFAKISTRRNGIIYISFGCPNRPEIHNIIGA